jgi:hypothetical protein
MTDDDKRLLDAAPALLAALQVLINTREVVSYLYYTDPQALNQARAAVAKATGEER